MRTLIVVMLLVFIGSSSAVAQVSSGTAFAVAPSLLITNQHVVAGCSSVDIIAADGRRIGTVVDADTQIDLALLRVTGLKGASARLRSSRGIRLGESVMVFGFPLTGSLASGGNFTSGLVSGLRGLRDAAGEIQITAPVQPGNSGGPLMDASGLVVGVVQAKLDALKAAIATGDIPQNVNFAISIDVLVDFLTKNGVAFLYGYRNATLDTARVAELAQTFTYRVECRGSIQQAAAPPSYKPMPPIAAVPETSAGSGTTVATSNSDWISDSKTGCKVWNEVPRTGESILWSGSCRNGLAQGRGVVLWFWNGKQSERNEGEYVDGKLNGWSVYFFASGARYEGEFKGSQRNGQGTSFHPDGSRYVGEWKNGKRHGRGVSYAADGSTLQAGEWRDNSFVRGP